MNTPAPSGSPVKWVWLLVIAALAVLALFAVFGLGGDDDASVDDPIVMPDPAQPTADTPLEDVAEGDSLTEESTADPVDPGDLPPAPPVDPLPSE